VSNDTISSRNVVSASAQVNSVANNFMFASGTLSFQEQINQTLSPLKSSAAIVAGGWTINAELDGGGTFQNAPTTTGASSNASLAIAGTLTGTLSPPGSGPTQLLSSKVTANVVFLPT
jgi:hypothetical protein